MEKNLSINRLIEGQFQYLNKTVWDAELPMVGYVGLNPSDKTNEKGFTKTGKRLRDFAEDNGFGGYYLANLYPVRSHIPDITRMDKLLTDEQVEKNGFVLEELKRNCKVVVAVWGKDGPVIRSDSGYKVLGLTKKGKPRHPLYVKKGTKFKELTL